VSKLKKDEDERCCTFVLHNEDHTLGNALRYMMLKDPDVDFCGYNVPHPSEHRINLRVQTRTKAASDVLKQALCEVQTTCDHVLEVFKDAMQRFKNNPNNNMDGEEGEGEEEEEVEMEEDE